MVGRICLVYAIYAISKVNHLLELTAKGFFEQNHTYLNYVVTQSLHISMTKLANGQIIGVNCSHFLTEKKNKKNSRLSINVSSSDEKV